MRLNPEKCTFRVKAGKFLGFYLTERGIEANLDKCRVILEMEPPYRKERIMKSKGMLTSLRRFISRSAQHALPFVRLLRKEENFEWTLECEEAFNKLKIILSQPPRHVQIHGGGDPLPIPSHLSGGNQCRPGKGDIDQL